MSLSSRSKFTEKVLNRSLNEEEDENEDEVDDDALTRYGLILFYLKSNVHFYYHYQTHKKN